jgi:uncharacterized protein (TIGR00645 family)
MIEEVNYWIETLVFEARWLLLPFVLKLIYTLALYAYHFVVGTMDSDQEMVRLLGQVDVFMLANLFIMVVQGSYQIFIRKFVLHREDRPGWLDHIDTGLLKVKVSQSIASITGVALLRDFFNSPDHRALLHIVFVGTAVAMAILWRITHPKEEKEEHSHEGQH